MSISAFRVAVCLAVVAVLLTVLSGVVQSVGALAGMGGNSLLSLLFVGTDDSLPSWYSTVLLLSCGVVAAVVAREEFDSRSRWRLHWAGLAIIFAYLSVDEAISIHEKLSPLGARMLAYLGLGGEIIQRAWVIPGALAVVAFLILYARFLLARPPVVRTLMSVSAAIYLAGAVGVEVLTDLYVFSSGGLESISVWQNVVRTIVLPHVEEFMEMIGVVLMIYALLTQAGKLRRSCSFRLER